MGDTYMAQPAAATQGPETGLADVSFMQEFIDNHGAPPVDEPAAPPGEAKPKQEAPPQEFEDEEDGDGLLDPETLAKLGLALDDQPDGEGSEGRGSEAADIDLAPLAKHLGVSESELSFRDGEIQVRTKVDGEEATVPLSKLREGYQLRQHFTRQQEQFLEERRQWEAAKQQESQQLQQQVSLADQVLSHEEQQLKQAYTRDWQALRQEDPAEYAAQVAEYNQKLNDIRQRRDQLMQTMQQKQEQMQQEMQQRYQQSMAAEAQRLAQATGWTDPEKFQANGQRLRSYLLKDVGFDEGQVNAIGDHRAFLLAEKARRFDELMAKVNTSRKQVKEAHPMPAGGTAQPRGGKRKQLNQAQSRLAKDGSLESAASVFAQLGL